MIQDDTSDGFRQGGGAGQTVPSQDRPASRSLGTQTQNRIGTHLRAMYDQIVQQPIPDRFRDLIDRLEETPASGRETPGRG